MSKPSLRLIHCSDGIRSGEKRRRNGHSFRPQIIEGGVRAMPGEHCLETALALFGLGLLVFYGNYLALLEANMIVLNGSSWTVPETAG
jgi:hypothetical protein